MQSDVRIRSHADVTRGLEFLLAQEARFEKALKVVDEVPLRLRPQGFEALVSILVHQQVSLASAAAIWARVEAGLNPLAPATIQRLSDDDLRGAGLSRPKIRYLRALADAVISGQLDLETLATADETTVRRHLTSVTGIGDWTADIYLLQCLGHADVWPAKDIGLQVAAQVLFELDNRPTADQLTELAEPWRPWRAVAARLLWSYYRYLNDLPKAR